MTGLSGSGKSSLAFDTIYKEGQRRYVESLSAYARQFLGNMEKPDVESIEGLSPAISIDQKTTSKNPRSTVGTVTEIYDYLRLLYARIGKPICPTHGVEISGQSIEQMTDKVLEVSEGRVIILAPIIKDRKGTHQKTIEQLKKDGYVRVRVNGEIYANATQSGVFSGGGRVDDLQYIYYHFLTKGFLGFGLKTTTKDDSRSFTEKQKDELYIIQDGKCAVTGQDLDSIEYAADHILPPVSYTHLTLPTNREV